jgi:hypothetical protein
VIAHHDFSFRAVQVLNATNRDPPKAGQHYFQYTDKQGWIRNGQAASLLMSLIPNVKSAAYLMEKIPSNKLWM